MELYGQQLHQAHEEQFLLRGHRGHASVGQMQVPLSWLEQEDLHVPRPARCTTEQVT